MTPTPLDQIGLRWRDHKSALWWLGLGYRRPVKFSEAFKNLPNHLKILAASILFVHSLPLIIILFTLERVISFGLLNLPIYPENFSAKNMLGALLVIAIFSLWQSGIFFGIGAGITYGIFWGIIAEMVTGIAGMAAITMAITLGWCLLTNSFIRVEDVPAEMDSLAGVFFLTITPVLWSLLFMSILGEAGGVAPGIIAGVLFLCLFFRFYYFPLHFVLILSKRYRLLYRFHPVAWDDCCLFPFLGLCQLLVANAEDTPEGEIEIERLIQRNYFQRIEALRAKIILIARKSKQLSNLKDLDKAVAQMPEGKKSFLSETKQVCLWINEISRLQTRLNTANRPAFQEMYAENLYQAIDSFRHRIQGFHEPLATEFGAAAQQWLKLAEAQRAAASAKLTTKPTEQLFRAGDPVNREQEAFAERTAVLEQLEQQVMLSTGCPGIVLYGRRRMGKSTLLRNLTGFLPLEVLTINVSMQNPQLAASLASFAHTLAEQVQTQAPGLKLNEALPDDLPGLFRFLTAANEKLAAEQYRLLLAVDEYEALDAKIGAGVFPHDLLDTLRESIQTHRHLTWIFAGSHEITELPHAAWTSALVSARTIEVPVFTLAETRLLLTEPLKHSSLWKDNEAKRPRFDAAFWGPPESEAEGSGIDFIHAQAGGWPHLVQLIAETLVDLINEEQAAAVTRELMQRALDKAIVRGHNVLYELLRRESTLPGEWEYLERFKRVDVQPLPDDETVARSLRRRELMAIANGEWRLRVPLMERWLRVRG